MKNIAIGKATVFVFMCVFVPSCFISEEEAWYICTIMISVVEKIDWESADPIARTSHTATFSLVLLWEGNRWLHRKMIQKSCIFDMGEATYAPLPVTP